MYQSHQPTSRASVIVSDYVNGVGIYIVMGRAQKGDVNQRPRQVSHNVSGVGPYTEIGRAHIEAVNQRPKLVSDYVNGVRPYDSWNNNPCYKTLMEKALVKP